MPKVAILMTCHDRREITLKCLRALFVQIMPENVDFSVYLVDDGCTDGTVKAIQREFCGLKIILGDGNLYWNQGMRRAWMEAEKGLYDAFLWLNDDTIMFPGSLKIMWDTLHEQKRITGQRGIVVGSCGSVPQANDRIVCPDVLTGVGKTHCSTDSSIDLNLTYGGYAHGTLLQPGKEPKPVQYFNGNLVLLSADVFAKLGNLCPVYRHSFGDFDYGIRANQAGFPVWVTAGFLAHCQRNQQKKWCNPQVRFIERWRALHSPKGIAAHELLHFLRLKGRAFPWFSVLKLYVAVALPKLFGASYS